MSNHIATINWKRNGRPFEYQKYSRNHQWKFDGGLEIFASASPSYLGDPENIDPEEAFVASIASCHMLSFLALACKEKLVVDDYGDEAVGVLEKVGTKLAITKVTLNPIVKWSGDKQPDAPTIQKLHHNAHEQCFIANSVKTEISINV